MLRKLDSVLGGNFKYVLGYLAKPHRILLNYLRWQRSGQSSERFVFVVGPPRSGTTLMQRIIGNHASVRSFDGETSVFSPKDVYDYERFSHIVSPQEFNEAIGETKSLVEFFVRMHLGRFGSGWVFLEKTPQHLKRIEFILSKFPEARIVNVMRDPRDCYLSGRSAGNIPQCESAASYAKYWERCVRARMAAQDDRVLDVFYEDFVVTPEEHVRKIMHFLGLEYEEGQLNFMANKGDPRSDEKAFLRIKEPVTGKTVGRWQTELNPEEQGVFVEPCRLYDSLRQSSQTGS